MNIRRLHAIAGAALVAVLCCAGVSRAQQPINARIQGLSPDSTKFQNVLLRGGGSIPTTEVDKDRDFGLAQGKGLHTQVFNKQLSFTARQDSTVLIDTHQYNPANTTLLLWHSTKGDTSKTYKIAISVRCYYLNAAGAADTTFAHVAEIVVGGASGTPLQRAFGAIDKPPARVAWGDSLNPWPHETVWYFRPTHWHNVAGVNNKGFRPRADAISLKDVPWSPYKSFVFRVLGPYELGMEGSTINVVAHLVGTPL